MTKKRCITFIDGYAKYASYLVNNDSSSLTSEEQENADDFVDAIREDYPHANIMGITDGYFDDNTYDLSPDFGIPSYAPMGSGDIIQYIVYYKE